VIKDSTKIIINTRPANQSQEFSELLRDSGFEVFEYPGLEVVPLPDLFSKISELEIKPEDWFLFSSKNALQFVADCYQSVSKVLPRNRVAVIGERSAQSAKSLGFNVEFISRTPNSTDFGREFSKYFMANNSAPEARLILMRGTSARKELPEILKSSDLNSVDCAVYSSNLPKRTGGEVEKLASLLKDTPVLVFTSAMAVENINSEMKSFGEEEHQLFLTAPTAVIGDTTAESARELGLNLELVSTRQDMKFFAEIIAKRFEGKANA
jgi:uroporphyrinogen-III synthase